MARVVTVGKESLGGNFDPAPAGTKLNAVVFEIEETTVQSDSSPNKGDAQGVVNVKITDDFPFAGADGKTQNMKGREVRYNNVPFYVGGRNEYQLAAFAQAVGWPVDDEGNIEIPEKHELAQRTQGKAIVVTLGVRTANDGRKYNTVSRWAPAGSKTSAAQVATPGGGAPGGGNPAEGNPWNV